MKLSIELKKNYYKLQIFSLSKLYVIKIKINYI